MNEWDPPGSTEKKSGGSQIGSRFWFCVAVLAMGMIWTAPNPAAILWIPMYPIGFSRALAIESTKYGAQVAYGIPIACCIGILVSRKRIPFLFFAGLLIAFCVVCTKGCHEILKGLSNIH